MRRVLEKPQSKLHAEGWKRLFTSTQFRDSTTNLYNTFAEVIKKLWNAENLSSPLAAFLAHPSVPLDKNSGLRPIGLGEVLQRISGKVIVTHAIDDIVTSARFFQVCAVHEAGCKCLI